MATCKQLLQAWPVLLLGKGCLAPLYFAKTYGLSSGLHRGICDIAYRWGFNDPTHFGRAFRERFGQSPREFRQSALQP
ncbi:MAG: helix-turn-helix domain-containing protein [Betaproteobacteria bacterium]|nr:helix-turn-helix domain-containing protein [Betaproteobacteria bacterium]